MISVRFQGKLYNITVIQAYAPKSNAEEAEVEWFYEDLQDLLELTSGKDVLFIIGDWNAEVGSQETPGVTGKFGLGRSKGQARAELRLSGSRHISHTPTSCSYPGENARSWEALGEARPGQSSLSAGALRYRAWAQSWSSAWKTQKINNIITI